MIFETSGSRIAYYRTYVKKVSQRQMDEDLGLNRGTINNYEQDKGNPGDQFFEKAADYFGCTANLLKKGIPNESRKGFEALDEIAKVPGVDPMLIAHIKFSLIETLTSQEVHKKNAQKLEEDRKKLDQIMNLANTLKDDLG